MATTDPAPSPAALGHAGNELVLALLAEISASLKDIKGHSARFEELVNRADENQSDGKGKRPETYQDSGSDIESRETRRSSRVRSHTPPSRRSLEPNSQSASKLYSNDVSVELIARDGFTGSGYRAVDVEERRFHGNSRNRSSRRSDNDVEVEAQSVEANSQAEIRSTDSSNETGHPRLKGYTSVKVKYGDFPHPDLYQQMFGTLLKKGKNASSLWLKEKGLVFARDERCSFSFDTASLAGRRRIASVQYVIRMIEDFARDLREKGGFFFFRESYNDRSENNKIYNGTHVFMCEDGKCKDGKREDGMSLALPILSADRTNFCEEIPEIRPFWETRDKASLRIILDKRKEASEMILRPSVYGNNLEPSVTYHYDGEPRDAERDTNSGWVEQRGGLQRPIQEVYQKFRDPHLTAPWRRLW